MINQYLILIILGTFIGIGLVLSIVRSVMGGMMGGGMMGGGYYPRYYGGGAAALGFTLVFVFLLGSVIMSGRVQNGQSILPKRPEKQEQAFQYDLEGPAPENDTYEGNPYADAASNVIRINQSPSQNRYPAGEAGLQPDGYSPNAPDQRIQEREAPAMPESNENGYSFGTGSYYIQTGAGDNETAALDQVRRMKQHLPGQAWLGLGKDASPFKFLVGPFPSEQVAEEALYRLRLNGYVRNVGLDGIEVFNVR